MKRLNAEISPFDEMFFNFTEDLYRKLEAAEKKYNHGDAWRNKDWERHCKLN